MVPEGPGAATIAQLTVALTVLGSIGFAVFLVVLVTTLRRSGPAPSDADGGSRQEPTADNRPSGHWSGLPDRRSRLLVLGGGMILPAILIGVALAWTLETMVELPDPGTADAAMTIDVTAERWRWTFSYPDGGPDTVDELIIPAGRPVALRLQSTDVIHSFWVPQLAGKLDALPDRPNTLVVEADEPGDYRGQCAEFCGLDHSRMTLVVRVVTAEEFQGRARNGAGGP